MHLLQSHLLRQLESAIVAFKVSIDDGFIVLIRTLFSFNQLFKSFIFNTLLLTKLLPLHLDRHRHIDKRNLGPFCMLPNRCFIHNNGIILLNFDLSLIYKRILQYQSLATRLNLYPNKTLRPYHYYQYNEP